jgi:hypothetical protein
MTQCKENKQQEKTVISRQKNNGSNNFIGYISKEAEGKC